MAAAVADTTPADNMSAEMLRRAAALMRDRASTATEGPWEDFAFADGSIFVERIGLDDDDVGNEIGCINRLSDAEHIASWHPVVALAVADWLDRSAATPNALAVARAYLGETP